MSQAVRKSKYEDSYARYLNDGGRVSRPVIREPERRVPKPEVRMPKPEVRALKQRQVPQYAEPDFSIEISRPRKKAFVRAITYTLIFLGAFLCVFSIAYIESRKFELNALHSELTRLKKDNHVLRSQIHETYNLVEVERYAIDVLGMQKPDESQFVYIDAVSVSYVVRHDIEENELRLLDVVKDMFASVAGLIRTDR
ncbi:MAG: hypothetical protein FWE91_12420 [Defluviitaleaceae bacterium]|nr:hypothetical protein [Defluviitaleaceae bacterium]MCL2836652.1 hypothetical protein [Defluviitaleaceae bacterium]